MKCQQLGIASHGEWCARKADKKPAVVLHHFNKDQPRPPIAGIEWVMFNQELLPRRLILGALGSASVPGRMS